MHYSFFSRLRDIIFAFGLFFLIKIAFERTTSFIEIHKNSIIHELDRSFIDQIYTAQRQLHLLEEHPIYADTLAHDIVEIKEQLTFIEEKYKKNSPGLALLGPIGSAAIVTKEEQLLLKLLDTITNLNNILITIANQTNISIPTNEFIEINNKTTTQKIDHFLDINKQLLKLLLL